VLPLTAAEEAQLFASPVPAAAAGVSFKDPTEIPN
jgi:hypothetical protein